MRACFGEAILQNVEIFKELIPQVGELHAISKEIDLNVKHFVLQFRLIKVYDANFRQTIHSS